MARMALTVLQGRGRAPGTTAGKHRQEPEGGAAWELGLGPGWFESSPGAEEARGPAVWDLPRAGAAVG